MEIKLNMNDKEELRNIEIIKDLWKNKNNKTNSIKTLASIPHSLFNSFYPLGWKTGTYIYMYRGEGGNLYITPRNIKGSQAFNIRRNGVKNNWNYNINLNKSINKLVSDFKNKRRIKFIISVGGCMVEFF